MMATMSMYAAVHALLRDVRATGYQRVVHVRVTTDALPGSMTTVPVTPERARVLGRLLAVQDSGVVADPLWFEKAQEVLIHPEDWVKLLSEVPGYAHQGALSIDGSTRIFGIPVTE